MAADNDAAVKRAEKYLNNLDTLKSDFTQVDPKGNISYGTFYLDRPGKLRWQYAPPVPVVIVVNGATMAYQDLEMDDTRYLDPDATMLGILASKTIRLNADDRKVIDVSKEAGLTRITVVHKGDTAEEGKAILTFAEQPYRLRKLEMTDLSGSMTAISFDNTITGLSLDKRMFVIDYNRKKRKQ